jgi:hypothetical protein
MVSATDPYDRNLDFLDRQCSADNEENGSWNVVDRLADTAWPD